MYFQKGPRVRSVRFPSSYSINSCSPVTLALYVQSQVCLETSRREKLMKPQKGSCIKLFTFLSLTALACSLLCAAVVAGATVVIGGADFAESADEPSVSSAVRQEFSGVLTDARCGARHTDSHQNAAGCARICVRDGSNYALVNGEQKYELDGDLMQINQYAGQRVTVAGVLDGGRIKVSSVNLTIPGEKK
jgi:hypothetical protein